ncbi:MAG: alcohol dehydrogenase catalytic domain-containing protein [Caldilineaceae bacterium]|nr:alcohol dehydrogenase catalytic domain-containing protein [Caldilineaceae bacterium]HRJ42272.1 alcohol dehydrogenase catalytic domain-containing protein [Caldilineaceae bacterium]
MKSLVWEAPRSMILRETPMPAVAPDEVLIRVAYGGICGSELSGYLGHNALRVPPLVMGHEFSGEITEMGAEAEGANPALKRGAWVTVNPLYCTADSVWQRRGLDHLCPSRRLVGAHRPGAYAEYVAVPAKTVSRLPAGMSLRTGSLTEPTACGLRIGELAGDVAGQVCLIIGAGPIGLLALQSLRLKGAQQVFIADLDGERLAMGAALGGIPLAPRQTDVVQAVKAATGDGAALAVDAVGSAVTRRQCVAAVQPTGTVILSGLHEEVSEMPAADIIRREIVVKGSFAYSPANFAQALGVLARGEMGLDPWIVEAPLGDGGAWFDRLIDAPGNVSKVLLKP